MHKKVTLLDVTSNQTTNGANRFASAGAKVPSLPRRLVSQSAPKAHRVRAVAFITIVPVPEQKVVVLAAVLDHGLGSRRRTVRGHVRDHVVEVRQELRVEERQDLLVELARAPGGHHVVVPRVARHRVLCVVRILLGGGTMPTEIVETVRAVAAAGVLELARRLGVHQRRLDELGLVIPGTSLGDRGSLLRVVAVQVLERADLVVHDTLVVILIVILVAILVAILVRLMRVVGVVRGDTGGKARGRRPIVVLVVVAVLVVALVRFREVGGRGGGRCARTRGVLRQASNGSVSPSVSYVRFLHLLHRLVLRGRVRVLPVRVLGRHVQHEIDGLVVESRRFRVLRQPIELLALLGGLRVRRAAQPLGEPEAESETGHQRTETGPY